MSATICRLPGWMLRSTTSRSPRKIRALIID
jgi:hypothetical protein